jgi:hypothetical protein
LYIPPLKIHDDLEERFQYQLDAVKLVAEIAVQFTPDYFLALEKDQWRS